MHQKLLALPGFYLKFKNYYYCGILYLVSLDLVSQTKHQLTCSKIPFLLLSLSLEILKWYEKMHLLFITGWTEYDSWKEI